MALLAFNKPFGVICQFTRDGDRPTLADFIRVPNVYPAGRLDTDSEGLLLLTDDGALQHRISHPKTKLPKHYWAQVEGLPTRAALAALTGGVDLGDFVTRPGRVEAIAEPAGLWPRNPPIRYRAAIPTSWLDLSITEGKNRQVRRMTAHVGLPTLRLIRHRIGPYTLEDLAPGEWRYVDIDALPHIAALPRPGAERRSGAVRGHMSESAKPGKPDRAKRPMPGAPRANRRGNA